MWQAEKSGKCGDLSVGADMTHQYLNVKGLPLDPHGGCLRKDERDSNEHSIHGGRPQYFSSLKISLGREQNRLITYPTVQGIQSHRAGIDYRKP